MSTSCLIIQKIYEEYRYVYCHWDGNPRGVGRTLLKSYNTEERVTDLISLGDISCLRNKIDPLGLHNFDNREEDVTVFYGRDRSEKGVEFKTSNVLPISSDYDVAYRYLFKDGRWYVSEAINKLCAFKELK